MDPLNSNLTTDAAASKEELNFVAYLANNVRIISEIHMEDLKYLEMDLADYEKVAVIYLLYGSDYKTIKSGLQHILQLVSKPVKNSTYLYEWARDRTVQNQEWKEMLIEALCIAQSYHVTDKLGLYQNPLENIYMPYRYDTSLNINKVIKALYLMAESWESDQAKKLISFVEKTFYVKISFNNAAYLEVYFLHWIQQGAISVYPASTCDLDVILNFLSQANLKTDKNNLEIVLHEVQLEKKHKSKLMRQGNIAEKEELGSGNDGDETRYRVRREKCGYALIINQREFSKEPNKKELKDYNTRAGTEYDCAKLKEVFKARGYMVIVHENLNNTKLLEAIRTIVKASVVYDSLIVCILSHGENGFVISSNCIPIPIREIQKIMASGALMDRPKMLVIQACQGGVAQTMIKTTSVDEIEEDGVTETTSSPHADLLTALSTISGFASFRDRNQGTWYIQELCKVIDNHGDKNHVLDLLIMVNNNVSQKTAHKDGKILGQLPEAKLTLRKKFYLPKKE